VRKEKKNSFCEYTNIIEDEERRKQIYNIIVPFIFFRRVVLSQPQEQERTKKKGTIGYISNAAPCIGSERAYPRLKIEFTNESHPKRRHNRTKQIQTHSNPRKASSPRTSPLAEAREKINAISFSGKRTHTHKRKKKGKKTHRSLQQFIVVLASASDNVGSFGDRRLGDDNLRA